MDPSNAVAITDCCLAALDAGPKVPTSIATLHDPHVVEAAGFRLKSVQVQI